MLYRRGLGDNFCCEVEEVVGKQGSRSGETDHTTTSHARSLRGRRGGNGARMRGSGCMPSPTTRAFKSAFSDVMPVDHILQ